jgi:hypothetical protein
MLQGKIFTSTHNTPTGVRPIAFAGSNGGYTGSRGYTGSSGTNGSNGFIGSRGLAGANGYTGSTGMGFTGSRGAGYTGSASTAPGTQGYSGSRGPAGYAGSAGGGGVGYTGSAGGGGGISGIDVYSGDLLVGNVVGLNFTGTGVTPTMQTLINGGIAAISIPGGAGGAGSGYTGSKGSVGYVGSAGSANLVARSTVSGSATITNGTRTTINITGFAGYNLYKIQTTAASWVTVYTNAAARTADASRSSGTDPASDAGVIAEIITTGAGTVSLTPAVLGFNDENPITNIIPIAVTNNSGATATITVTLTLVKTEIV